MKMVNLGMEDPIALLTLAYISIIIVFWHWSCIMILGFWLILVHPNPQPPIDLEASNPSEAEGDQSRGGEVHPCTVGTRPCR